MTAITISRQPVAENSPTAVTIMLPPAGGRMPRALSLTEAEYTDLYLKMQDDFEDGATIAYIEIDDEEVVSETPLAELGAGDDDEG